MQQLAEAGAVDITTTPSLGGWIGRYAAATAVGGTFAVSALGVATLPLSISNDISRIVCRGRPFAIEPGSKPAAGFRQRRVRGVCGPGDGRLRLAVAIEEYFESRAAGRGRRAKRPHLAAPQCRQRSFYMLAGSERIYAVVGAAAGIREAIEASNLHFIAAVARRADTKIAEETVLWFECGDIRSSTATTLAL